MARRKTNWSWADVKDWPHAGEPVRRERPEIDMAAELERLRAANPILMADVRRMRLAVSGVAGAGEQEA